MSAGTAPARLPTPLPWGKKHRMLLMNISFWTFWAAFPFAYFGGVRNEPNFISLSFVLFVVAGLVPLATKK
jgi:hypothetical protein